jgi:glycosyltransferase involved in cell wall biosynthesis
LVALRPVLEEAGGRQPGLILKIISDRFFSLQHMLVQSCPWSEATEAEELARADIGISWLPDDDWSRGKCGLKILQYMAAGLPVIANPVGVQADMVRHGESGFLASTPAEWVKAIARLARDPELRKQMGARGREQAGKYFGVGVGAKKWISLLGQIPRRQAA